MFLPDDRTSCIKRLRIQQRDKRADGIKQVRSEAQHQRRPHNSQPDKIEAEHISFGAFCRSSLHGSFRGHTQKDNVCGHCRRSQKKPQRDLYIKPVKGQCGHEYQQIRQHCLGKQEAELLIYHIAEKFYLHCLYDAPLHRFVKTLLYTIILQQSSAKFAIFLPIKWKLFLNTSFIAKKLIKSDHAAPPQKACNSQKRRIYVVDENIA